ncbi:MAG TPA: hypothetical protein VMT51_10030 [Dongiaceae bacterium]|nr:hypothetical protein [Dongiaceae bacterium]
MRRKFCCAAASLGLVLLFSGTRASAQDVPQPTAGEPAKPAAKAYGPIGAEPQDPNQEPETMQPDDRPLTGFQQATVGTPIARHSYWLPGISYYNTIQSNGASSGTSDGWNSSNYIAGNVSLLEAGSRSRLTLNASIGGFFSSNSQGNGWYQQIGVADTFNWERWQLTFLDQFAYLPQAQFGFGAGSGLGLPGVGGSLGGGSVGLGPGYDPGSSIFAATGPRYTNAFGTQANYLLTPRSSVTFGGMLSLMRFTDSGSENIESNTYIANLGYNYQISRADTIGVQYSFSSFHYLGFDQAIGSHTIQAVYGRKLTGRLALSIAGGPQIVNFRKPEGTTTATRFVTGSATTTLSYALQNGSLSVAYFHGLTGGSGALAGASTDQVTVSGTRRLSRLWSGEAHVGFARNRNADTDTGLPNPSFHSTYVGTSLNRPLGRNASLTLGYTGYIASSNNVGGGDFTTHQITVGVSWHARPFVLH